MIGDYFKFSPTYYVIAIGILLASHGYVYFTGKEHGLEKYYDFKSAVEAQQAILKADAEKARIEAERITADYGRSWAVALDYASRAPGRVTVRVPAPCNPSGLRPIPGTSEGLTRTHLEEPGFSTSRDVAVEECEARLNAAVIDAAWIEHVKGWADKQSKVKR